jgi:hypothetical protein
VPQPFSVQPNGNTQGPGTVTIDASGNMTLDGTLTVLGGNVYLAQGGSAASGAPGLLNLFTGDGVNLQQSGQGGQNGNGFVAAPATFTGVTTAETLMSLPLPAGELAAGQHYVISCSGVMTTTADTQTITLNVNVGATAVLTLSSLNPDSTGDLTNGPWSFDADIWITAGPKGGAAGKFYVNFFLNGANQGSPTAVSAASSSIALTVTPSANAVSITIEQGDIRRVV